ncbi:MotA/TolQ/ExbB proton channel family protein [Kiloniella spongiae]|uniref:MotA/TolQ/ExbB proton channel family protein n=1 Tax=Kiloniella spongiae TaxID=1489064 RepID=UPI00069A827F|nr:MotA/TolQ/ExbB proton channel family protein [Kiloniella spongiae]
MLQTYEMLEKAGIVGYCLVGLSFLTLTIFLSKILQYLWLRFSCERELFKALDLVRSGKILEAKSLADKGTPWSQKLFYAALNKGLAVNRDEEQRWDDEAQKVGDKLLTNLESGLSVIALIAALSPLLGLLGTVIGMISAFQALESAGNNVDPSLLSGGIWEALLTTALGLVVAMPAMVLHALLKSAAYQQLTSVVEKVNSLTEHLYLNRGEGLHQGLVSPKAAE